jgi:hypothetical protein
MFDKTLVLFWYLVGSRVIEDVWDSWRTWKGVDERSNEDSIIFKHYKRKINSKKHNN